MHDEWFEPMAPETKAFFKLAREEAPDYIVSLHSHGRRTRRSSRPPMRRAR
jgi:hypothetical protein